MLVLAGISAPGSGQLALLWRRPRPWMSSMFCAQRRTLCTVFGKLVMQEGGKDNVQFCLGQPTSLGLHILSRPAGTSLGSRE